MIKTNKADSGYYVLRFMREIINKRYTILIPEEVLVLSSMACIQNLSPTSDFLMSTCMGYYIFSESVESADALPHFHSAASKTIHATNPKLMLTSHT